MTAKKYQSLLKMVTGYLARKRIPVDPSDILHEMLAKELKEQYSFRDVVDTLRDLYGRLFKKMAYHQYVEINDEILGCVHPDIEDQIYMKQMVEVLFLGLSKDEVRLVLRRVLGYSQGEFSKVDGVSQGRISQRTLAVETKIRDKAASLKINPKLDLRSEPQGSAYRDGSKSRNFKRHNTIRIKTRK